MKEELHLEPNILNLTQARRGSGLSGIAVCRKAGISRTRLSDLERGHTIPSPRELERIASAIGELLAAQTEVRQLAVQLGLEPASRL